VTKLQHALDAVKRGWTVFPVGHKDGKVPYPSFGDWGDQIRGLRTQEDRAMAVVEWWSIWPDANPAIACKPSGLLVIDCDSPKPDVPADGVEEYVEACKNLGGDSSTLWDTMVVETGRKGLHLYYQWPGDYKAQGSKLHGCTNVDIRGNGKDDGNYVLGPGSVTTYGTYRTEHDRTPVPAYPWLVQLVAHPPKKAVKVPTRPRTGIHEDFFGDIGGMFTWLAEVPPGNQDNAINWAVWRCREDGVDRDEVHARLAEAVQRMKTEGEAFDDAYIQRKINNVYRG
jgi:hypothetical protein